MSNLGAFDAVYCIEHLIGLLLGSPILERTKNWGSCFFLVIKGSVGGARELTGGNQIFLQWNWSFVAKQKNSVPSEQPTLVWTNSAQMMQPYLPLAVTLPGLSQYQEILCSAINFFPSAGVPIVRSRCSCQKSSDKCSRWIRRWSGSWSLARDFHTLMLLFRQFIPIHLFGGRERGRGEQWKKCWISHSL